MRKEIKLVPGVAYNMQVAARSGLGASPYSPIIYIPAQAKSTPPASVTGLSLEYYGVQFVASWNASAESDFDYYKYYFLKGPSYNTPSIAKRTMSTKIALTDVENRSLWGDGVLNNNIKIVVSVVDKSGNESSLVTSSAANNTGPTPPGSAPSAIAGVDSILLYWTEPTGAGNIIDIVKYNIYVSTKTSSLGDFSLIDSTSSLSYNYSTTYYGKTHYFYIKSVDKFGNESSTGSAIATLTSGPIVPSVVNGLISNIKSYYRNAGSSVTFNTRGAHGMATGNKIYVYGTRSLPATITSITGNHILTATTSAAHGFSTGNTVEIVGSSVGVFNEKSIITAITTSPPYTFSYSSSSTGNFVSPATAYVLDGTATADTLFGTPVSVVSVPNTTQFVCSPNAGTSTLVIESTDFTVTGATGSSGFIRYSLTGSGSFYAGQRVSISGISPYQYNITDAIITSTTASSNLTIKSNATGTFISGGTASVRPFGDAYPSDNAVRIKDDGITVGNMSSGFIVGISPTSFNMQSSGSSTRLALSSSHIDMYKDGNKTVQFDGNTGDAIVVGGFATGFSGRRVTINDDISSPEKISFYSGFDGKTYGLPETLPGYLDSDVVADGKSGYRGTVLEKSSSGYTRSLKVFDTNTTTTGDPIAVFLNPTDSNYDTIYTATTSTAYAGPGYTTLAVSSTAAFPSSGKVLVNLGGSVGQFILTYTSKDSTNFNGISTNLVSPVSIASGKQVHLPYIVTGKTGDTITYTAPTSYTQGATAVTAATQMIASSWDYWRGVINLVPPELVPNSETLSDPYITTPYLKYYGVARGNKSHYFRSRTDIHTDRLEIYASYATYISSHEDALLEDIGFTAEINNGLTLSGYNGLYAPAMRPVDIIDDDNAGSATIPSGQTSLYRYPDGGLTSTTGATVITLPLNNTTLFVDAFNSSSLTPTSNTGAAFPATIVAAGSNGANLSTITQLSVTNVAPFDSDGGYVTVANFAGQPQLFKYTSVNRGLNRIEGLTKEYFFGGTGGTTQTGRYVTNPIRVAVDNQKFQYDFVGYTGTATSPNRFTGCYSYPGYGKGSTSGATFNAGKYISTKSGIAPKGVTFTAPYSGRVMISVGATVQAASGKMILGWSLRDGAIIGSGDELYAGTEETRSALVLSNAGASSIYVMGSSPNKIIATGLYANYDYNVTLTYINTMATAKTIDNIQITVTPLP